MQLPPGYRRIDDGNHGGGVVREDLADLPAEIWWDRGSPLAGAGGRGAVAVLELATGERGVARTYRRGGVFAGVASTRFLAADRAEHELCVLAELARRGVAVVEPMAAVHRRAGALHQLRLVTRLVAGSAPLPAGIAAHPRLVRAAVRAAGRVVGEAFSAGLQHRDLHPDNLLVVFDGDVPVVRILDLDRARLRSSLSQDDRDRMLLRLARYLERHADRLPLQPRRVDYLRFLHGMGFDRAARRREIGRLSARYRRAVLRHRLVWWSQG